VFADQLEYNVQEIDDTCTRANSSGILIDGLNRRHYFFTLYVALSRCTVGQQTGSPNHPSGRVHYRVKWNSPQASKSIYTDAATAASNDEMLPRCNVLSRSDKFNNSRRRIVVGGLCLWLCNGSTSERNGCRFGVAVTRQNIAMTFGAEKLEWCGYSPLNFFWRYVYSIRQNPRTWQTLRRTDNALRKSYRHIQLSSILHFYSLYYFAFKIAATEDKYPECWKRTLSQRCTRAFVTSSVFPTIFIARQHTDAR